MFEPAKNKKASDFSEALILQGRDGEIIFNDLWEGGLNQKPQPRCGCRPFLWALRSSCAWLAPIKKALRNRKAFCWSGWRDSNSRPLAPHASALPGCATSRFGCLIWPKPNLPVVKHMGTGHPERDCKDNKFITHPQTH